MMSMPGVRKEEESSAPSESQPGECAHPAEPAQMSLSEAVQAVRAERDMLLVRRNVTASAGRGASREHADEASHSLQVALDAERAAHANAVAQRDAALQRFQAMDEQAQLVRQSRAGRRRLGRVEAEGKRITPSSAASLTSTPLVHQEHEEIEAAIGEFERIAKQERQRADTAEQALKHERAAFRALREADLELERRTSMAEPPASAVEAAPLEPAVASQQLSGAEDEDLSATALGANQRAEDAVRQVGDQLLEKRRARMETATQAASALAQLSIQRDALKCGAFGELVCAAAAAVVRPELSMSEAVRYAELPPPPPPPSPPIGLARQLAFRSRRSVSSGSLPSLIGQQHEQQGAMEVWHPDAYSWQQITWQAPSQPPPSTARQNWVQF